MRLTMRGSRSRGIHIHRGRETKKFGLLDELRRLLEQLKCYAGCEIRPSAIKYVESICDSHNSSIVSGVDEQFKRILIPLLDLALHLFLQIFKQWSYSEFPVFWVLVASKPFSDYRGLE